MKSIYSLLVIGTVVLGTFASVNADTDTNTGTVNTGTISISGVTQQQYKNRGQAMKHMQEQLKEKREEMKQKRKEIKPRRSGSGMTQTGMINQTGAVITTEQLACARTAIAKREASILASFSTFSTSVINAFTARAAGLSTAWTLSGREERKTAINSAWKTWKDAVKMARETENANKKTAWNTFKTEAQACKTPEALADMNNAEGSISSTEEHN